jgi:hypothetical protein
MFKNNKTLTPNIDLLSFNEELQQKNNEINTLDKIITKNEQLIKMQDNYQQTLHQSLFYSQLLNLYIIPFTFFLFLITLIKS